jgi:DNA-binding CsgD family transcriptional regulator
VRDGQIWASNPQLEGIFQALMQVPSRSVTGPEAIAVLSKREEEIARLVASGLSNREISTKLGLSQHTIKNYLFRIFEKFGFSTRVELALYMLNQTKRPVVLDAAPTPKQARKLLCAPLNFALCSRSVHPDIVAESERGAHGKPCLLGFFCSTNDFPRGVQSYRLRRISFQRGKMYIEADHCAYRKRGMAG